MRGDSFSGVSLCGPKIFYSRGSIAEDQRDHNACIKRILDGPKFSLFAILVQSRMGALVTAEWRARLARPRFLHRNATIGQPDFEALSRYGIITGIAINQVMGK
ncbi:MAG: hypothetical protein CBB70_04395 [Planctomycetaceae bacterium TMED10]|nr:MAG: hypothetical protein CBB70_09560 [Planctomycetaceae bacterium TMED10]OUT69427.1 MAG: hypothetical protein CBB70_04395 [Planctomycetaceae bacterium TMED10]